jgi:hypothetical protein
MRAEDMRVRQELLESGELGGAYVPQMEAVHIGNAARLRELMQYMAGLTSLLRARMERRRHD